jgi:hypothetical protein
VRIIGGGLRRCGRQLRKGHAFLRDHSLAKLLIEFRVGRAVFFPHGGSPGFHARRLTVRRFFISPGWSGSP